MWQPQEEQTAQAHREADELTLTLEQELARGRIDETFTASLNAEGFIVPSGRAPTTHRQTMLMMTVRRLMTMDKQDDGTFSIKLDSAALRAAADKIRAAAQQAQNEASQMQAHQDASDKRAAAAALEHEKENERRAILDMRARMRSNF